MEPGLFWVDAVSISVPRGVISNVSDTWHVGVIFELGRYMKCSKTKHSSLVVVPLVVGWCWIQTVLFSIPTWKIVPRIFEKEASNCATFHKIHTTIPIDISYPSFISMIFPLFPWPVGLLKGSSVILRSGNGFGFTERERSSGGTEGASVPSAKPKVSASSTARRAGGDHGRPVPGIKTRAFKGGH